MSQDPPVRGAHLRASSPSLPPSTSTPTPTTTAPLSPRLRYQRQPRRTPVFVPKPEQQTLVDTLHFRTCERCANRCPKCRGKFHIHSYRPGATSGGSGVIWDCDCVNCGATLAQWLPGHAGWMLLYTCDGERIPNPHNLPGYGLPDPEDEEVAGGIEV